MKEGRVAHDLVPVPKELSSDCGMAIELREADAGTAFRVLDGPALKRRGIYKRAGANFEPVEP